MTFIPAAAVRGAGKAAATTSATATATRAAAATPTRAAATGAAATATTTGATTTAAARAAQLRGSGATKAYTTQTLRDEFGATIAEAGNLFDQARGPRTPVAGPAFDGASRVVTASGGGVLLGAIGYVLVLTYFRDGLPGVKKWLRAKFLNKVTA